MVKFSDLKLTIKMYYTGVYFYYFWQGSKPVRGNIDSMVKQLKDQVISLFFQRFAEGGRGFGFS